MADAAPRSEELTAPEAAALLGVKLPTLYAYVSRGLLRSQPGTEGRARRYRRQDVERLRDRGRRGSAARGALRWGAPVLDSSITAMAQAGPVYRGHPALALARAGHSFEAVAELLWSGALPDPVPSWRDAVPAIDLERVSALLPAGAAVTSRNPLVIAAAAAADPGRYDRRPEAVIARARGVARLLVASLALPARPSRAAQALEAPTIADGIRIAYALRSGARVRSAIDQTLVVMADHELNASTFAARVAASTHADVYAAVQAGLATLSGPLHGAVSDQVEALVAEVGRPEAASRIVHERMRRGERIPGFGHSFYEGADPRAVLLLETAEEIAPRSRELRVVQALVRTMEVEGRPLPNVDVGVVGLRAALGMPPGAGAGLFAIGRSAGWVAHVLEQYETGHLLRPRARYRGAEPGDA